MRRTVALSALPATLTATVSALLLAGCGDVSLPEPSDLDSRVSSLQSQVSSGISSLTSRPTDPSSPAASPTGTDSPATSPPATPTSSAPTTPSATSAAPTTSAPTRTSKPATTQPPATSESPDTSTPPASPTTSATPSATPTSVTPTATPSGSTTTPATEPASSSTSGWPWVLLGLLAVAAGVGTWLLARRRGAVSAWQDQASAAVTRGRWVSDGPVAAVVGAPSAAALDQAWGEASSGLAEVDQSLFALRETAPDEQRRADVEATRTSLAELRTALLALVEGSREGAAADVQRQQAAAVERARSALSAALDRLTPPS